MVIFDKELVSSLLETKDIARTLVYTDVTGSTMDDARRLAHQVSEYPHGTAVLSERQTKARGARDHKWDASNTGNIYLSLILHMPPIYKTFEGRFDVEVAACLAVVRVARAFGVTAATPKWPNDVWVKGHKLAGFLVEDGRFNIPGSLNCLIILGMGVNVNSDVRRNSELSSIATSVKCELGGVSVNREKFFAEVCLALEHNLEQDRVTNLELFRQENVFCAPHSISVSCLSEGRVIDGKFMEICDNWDICFSDKADGKTYQGRSDQYTVRPKVLNKILVVFSTNTVAYGGGVGGGGDGGSGDQKKSSQRVASMLQALVDTSRHVVCQVPASFVSQSDEWMQTCSLLVLADPVANHQPLISKLDMFIGQGGRILASGMAAASLAKMLNVPVREAPQAHAGACLVNLPDIPTHLSSTDAPENSELNTNFAALPSHEIVFPSGNMCFQFFENEKAVTVESNVTGTQDKADMEENYPNSGSPSQQEQDAGLVVTDLSSTSSKSQVWAVYGTAENSVAACTVTSSANPESSVALIGFDIGADYPLSTPSTGHTGDERHTIWEDRFKRDVLLQKILTSLLH